MELEIRLSSFQMVALLAVLALIALRRAQQPGPPDRESRPAWPPQHMLRGQGKGKGKEPAEAAG